MQVCLIHSAFACGLKCNNMPCPSLLLGDDADGGEFVWRPEEGPCSGGCHSPQDSPPGMAGLHVLEVQ